MRISDWSSDVCSSDLSAATPGNAAIEVAPTTTVTATLAPAPVAGTLTVTGPSGAVAGQSAYDASPGVLVFTPAEPLAWSSTFTPQVPSPAGSVRGATWRFTPPAEPTGPAGDTIFGPATPPPPARDTHAQP